MCENIDSIDNLSNEGLDIIKRTIVHIELDNKLNVHFVGTAREMYDEDYYNVKSKVKKK